MALLTTSAVVAGISSVLGTITNALSNFAHGAIIVIKIAVSISVAITFATALITLFGFVQSVVYGSIVGEFFSLVSMCLPFNAGTVFNAILVVIDCITAFLVARKVYDLTSHLIKVSS